MLFLALSAVTPAGAGQAEKNGLPLPIGVAAADGKVGYVPGAKEGVEAINLETGAVLWSTKEPAKPLALSGKLLAAQVAVPGKANHVRIVVLDTTDKGKQVRISEPVVFPDWVSVAVTYGRTFSAHAYVDKGDLVYKWQANAFYAGGAPPPPEVVKAAMKEASGVARINLESGKVAMLPADKAPMETKVKLPDELAKIKSQQYWTGSDWKTDLFVIGKTVSALSVKQAGGVSELALKRWDLETGKALNTVELMRGKELWPQVSLDRKYVFVHQALVKEQLPPGDYAWWVFSLETGKQVGKFPFEGTMNNVTVIGPRAYYLVVSQKIGPIAIMHMMQPRFLRAIDLKSGKMAWQHPVEGQKMLPPLP
jgi:hypothetical protein